MIKQLLVFLLIFLGHFTCAGQEFDKKYFINSKWFIDNLDSTFYKNDTLKIVKNTNKGPAPMWSSEFAENEMDYLGHGYFVQIEFKRYNRLNFNWRYDNAVYAIPTAPWSWNFNKKDITISIFDGNNHHILTFKPISEKEIEIDSRFNNDKLKTLELTVIRIK